MSTIVAVGLGARIRAASAGRAKCSRLEVPREPISDRSVGPRAAPLGVWSGARKSRRSPGRAQTPTRDAPRELLEHTYAPYAAFAFDDDNMPPSSSRNFSTICPSQMTCITLSVSKPPMKSFTRNRLWMSGSLSRILNPSRQ